VTPRPALAYISVPHEISDDSSQEASDAYLRCVVGRLRSFADQQGYVIVGVFTDVEGRTEFGLYALLDEIRKGTASAVVVPELAALTHVGCLRDAQAHSVSRYLRARLLAMT
jgi:hypothetical protein